MSEEFQYPCDCGHINNVTVADSGKTIECKSCMTEISLPGLRDIKKLEPVESSQTEKTPQKTWTYEKGIMFSYGMGAIIIGLIIACTCFYIGYYKFPSQTPDVRGDWNLTSEKLPEKDHPVFAYSPKPAKGQLNYDYTMWDPAKEVWFFQDKKKKPQPREYFSKWGDSYKASIEMSVQNAEMKDLWKFWYETEPKEPLKEWVEPTFALNRRFAYTFYSFAGVGGAIAIIGLFMVFYSVTKK